MSDTVDALDLVAGIGQRTDAFIFRMTDGGTGAVLGEVHPSREATVTLDQSAGAVITRALTLEFDEDESASINPLSARIEPFMLTGGREWPLGHYLFTDPLRQDYAEYDSAPGEVRSLMSSPLADRMAIVDTELEHSFTADDENAGVAIRALLAPLPILAEVDDSASVVANTWAAGTARSGVLGTLADLGGYLAPWFDHHGVLQARRRFEPALAIPDFDWDASPHVYRDSITRADALAYTPNRYVVVGNGGTAENAPVVAYCDVPSTAPHSALNIGFVRPRVVEVQVSGLAQAQEYAQNMCLQQTVAETIQVSGPPDPRYEAHQVIRFEGELWLHVAWSMELAAGGTMRHTLQRALRPTATMDTPTIF